MEEIDLPVDRPKVALVKAMARRLAGDPLGAIETLRPVVRWDYRYDPIASPDRPLRSLAIAWMLESMAFAGVGAITVQQIRKVQSEAWDEVPIRIHAAVLYRLLMTSGLRLEGVDTPEEILTDLDTAFVAERPLLTMLLQDILPRPLAGVAKADDATGTQA